MANKIVLKKSSVAAKVPLATDLDIGELAVNLADAKLYTKNASGTVIQLGGGSGTGDVTGPSSSTDTALARFNGTTGKVIQNSSVTLDGSGNLSGILSQQFSNGSAVTLAAGKLWYNGTDGSWNMGMGGGNITQQVGEELFRYGKASAAITDSPLQLVYKTGTVGASGVITFAPAVAGITDADQIIGCATENISLNGFGRVTTYGIIHGITTNGSAYGETWADNQDIYYNPTTGGLTKTLPTAPGLKVYIGTVINAGSGGSGSFIVKLGVGTYFNRLSDVQVTSAASGNTIIYDASAGYWKNANLIQGTGISVTNGAGSITIANTGVTSVTGTSPVVSSGGTTPAISLASGYGDTQNPYASKTANYVLAAPNGSAGVPTFRAIVAADIPTLNQNTTGTASNVTGTVAIANGGSGATTAQTAMNAFAGAVTSGSYLRGNGTNVVMSTIQAADVPTLNQSTTGSAASMSISGQTGLLTFTGLTTVNRAKTVRDAADTILELGGSYTPTGTWNWSTATATWPTFNQNTTGTASNVTGTVAVANGGTGQTTYTNGQLLIGNTTGNTLTKATLTQGTGITITNGTGSITVTNSAPDQTVAFTNGTGISVTGTYPNFTVTNTSPSSGGTVTSVSGTGTVAGISLSGTVTSSGNISLGGTFALPTGQVPGKMIYDSFTATAGQTTFTTSTTYTSGKIQVMVNGCTMVNGSDVTVTSGTSIVFATGLTVNDKVTAIYPT
jgi:hypothetical protein